MTGDPGPRAAWDAYLAIVEGLLPALHNRESDDAVNPRLGGVVIRIRRYAPLWPADGPILIAAACGAVRLLRHGDRDALTSLATAIAHRLFLLSAGPARPHHCGRRNQRLDWSKRREPGQRRSTRHDRRQHEKGFPDD